MSWIDVAALVVVALGALAGARRGLLTGAFSLAGLVLGLVVGGKLAPHLLGSSRSAYVPLVGLAGALILAIAFESLGSLVGGELRRGLSFQSLRTVDSVGGLALGVVTSVALLWVIGAAALHTPRPEELRAQARHSFVLRNLMEVVPPQTVLQAISRIDPFPAIVGPAPPDQKPDPRVLAVPGVREAAPSVVRVLANACGLGYAGTGWVAGDELVVTAAHVVAGAREIIVEAPDGRKLRAVPVEFDGTNDLAVLHVAEIELPVLRIVDAREGDSGAMLGYPGDGPFDAEAARVGTTAPVFAPDYSRRFVQRTITSIRARVRHGNSGGPVVNRRGAVEVSVFGARRTGDTGYGVPGEVVRDVLDEIDLGGVSTGACLD